ncbi:LexA-binding, inner membrane-associated putative hydrolase [Lacibacter cauensis]|uniref:LexA-binding, inner membrane-associated putative hydrolase n=1 Tax=Lacibacter cauensis TaxID=510947 RepID=A0A562SWP1_9BACT|nr:metal-dependent hydrolase [Lacibacter cauensis]TWI85448.1 LexA-binding, inner membrane-associated putative hydrolase [Lacibacter cauensis]
MFLGHFAVAFAAKKADKTLSLGSTMLAAQWLDLLWPVLLLTGTETAAIAPAGSNIPLEFTSYPFSHSLLTVAGWALLFAVVFYGITKQLRSAFVIAFLVLSHWFLDWLVHIPDLPLTPFSNEKLGLGLWNYKTAELLLELLMYAIAVALFFKSRVNPGKRKSIITWSLIIFLLVIHIMNVFGPPPPAITPVAVVGLLQWIFVAWGYWAD